MNDSNFKKTIKIIKKAAFSIALAAALFALTAVFAVDAFAGNVPETLIPGGMAFGVKFFTKGIIIVGISDVKTSSGLVCPADNAGLAIGDIILKVNGKEINDSEEFGDAMKISGGKGVAVEYERDGKTGKTNLVPALSAEDNAYRAGIWVRDSTAGIGTVTFVDEKDLRFGGLGHGICDIDTGKLMPLKRGVIVAVDINEVVRGLPDDPGEMKGDFSTVPEGELYNNTANGVFGYFDKMPRTVSEPLKVAENSEIKEGKAYIYCTLDSSGPKKYEIEIEKILKDSGSNKNFIIKVTDTELLDKTGGIIQGMSGSPVIQDGKLAGAVTHVFVNEPSKGYGIFIRNMLKAS